MRTQSMPCFRAVAALALGLLLGAALAAPAAAQGAPSAAASKSIKTEAEFLAYDAEKQTVTVKVIKPGTGKEAKALQPGQQAEFKVKPEGSVLSRTTVAIQGVKAELSELAAGKTVNVYWRPDDTDPNARFARKIDVVLSDEELDAKYGTE
jgi:hypothetical protein